MTLEYTTQDSTYVFNLRGRNLSCRKLLCSFDTYSLLQHMLAHIMGQNTVGLQLLPARAAKSGLT